MANDNKSLTPTTLEQYVLQKLTALEDENQRLKYQIEELEEQVNEADDLAVTRYEIIKRIVEMFRIKPEYRYAFVLEAEPYPKNADEAKLLKAVLLRMNLISEPDADSPERVEIGAQKEDN